MDADDFTRCAGCQNSLCLATHDFFIDCETCDSAVCFSCLEQAGAIKDPYEEVTFSKWRKVKMPKECLEPEDFVFPYEWVESKDIDFGLINKCPFCDDVLSAMEKEDNI